MERKKFVLLVEVSQRTGLGIDALINALEESGIFVSNGPNFILKRSHISIISTYYVRAVKDLFTLSKKHFRALSPQRKEEYKSFFSKFIPEVSILKYLNGGFAIDVESALSADFDFEYLLEYELSDILISSYFYASVYKEYSEEFNKYFNPNKLLRIKLRLKSSCKRNDMNWRDQFFILINFGNYHIFSSEEDQEIELRRKDSFSYLVKGMREAKIKNSTNFSFNHEKKTNINTKSTIK